MKKIIKVMFVLVLFMFVNITFAAEDDYEDNPIIIGGDEYFPPFEYVDGNGNYKGFNIDIMHAIAIEKGLDIEIRPMPWKITLESLVDGDIQVVQGIKYTKEREEIFSFSKPYIESSLSIFIPKTNNYIKSLDDLENKVVAIQENDVAYDVIKSIPGIKTIKTQSQLQALQSLIDNNADAYIGNLQSGLYSIQKYNYSDFVKVIGSPINPERYGIAVIKGNEALLNVFDDGLRIIKRNGTYDKIHDKWFGEEIFGVREVLKKYILVFMVIGSILSIIVLINVRLNKRLKREVSKQIKEVEQSNIFKENIINSIFSGLMTFDTSGIVLSINKKVSEICYEDVNYFIGNYIEDIKFKNYIDIKLFNQAINTGELFINQESKVMIKGKERVIEYNIYPIKGSDEVIRGITITFIDITQRKRNEEQIRRKDKLESLGRLTANIAHEIRNPLTAIKTYVELIPKKINNEAFQKQIVKDVPLVIERLNDLITELLEYAKPRKLNKEVFLLEKPILEVLSLIEGELNKNNIKLKTNLANNCLIKVDSQQFKQILINLIINSIEAVKSCEVKKISITVLDGGEHMIVEVKDNGVGITKENMSIIFEPFYTKKSTGTGLGLSIAQQLAEENDGFLSVESEVGNGTSMRLYLPYFEESIEEIT